MGLRRAPLPVLLPVLLSVLACRREEPPAPVLGALFDVALESGGLTAAEANFARAELAHLAEQAGVGLRRGEGSSEVLRRVVFGEGKFVRQVYTAGAAQEARFMLLPSVLRERRGTCVGLGTLYLALAERLGVPASGVLVPGHFFVRLQDRGRSRNVELLREGEEMPDGWYRRKYGVTPSGGAAYLRELSITEVTAVLRFNLGNDLRERGHPEDALARYRHAVADFPTFAEAHASIGLTQHLLGRLGEARIAYHAAARLHPGLPGLQKNLALLEEQLAGLPAKNLE